MNSANDREFSLSQIFKNYNTIKKNKAQIKKVKVLAKLHFNQIIYLLIILQKVWIYIRL